MSKQYIPKPPAASCKWLQDSLEMVSVCRSRKWDPDIMLDAVQSLQALGVRTGHSIRRNGAKTQTRDYSGSSAPRQE